METVTVNKQRLLETLEDNRETHMPDFDLAWEGFRTKAAENLEAKLAALKAAPHATKVDIWVNLEPPEDHAADYDRAMQTLDWHQGEEFELSEAEFRQYVQNQWAWADRFTISNRLYT